MILTVNAGSSSVRLALFHRDTAGLRRGAAEKYDRDTAVPSALLRRFLASAGPDATVHVVAHRVVHGGPRLVGPRMIDEEVEAEIARLTDVAPLHNPPALEWIHACRERLDQVLQVAAFDTAFFSDLPGAARAYALPADLCERYGLRRYGFHGMAHEALWRRWCALRPDLDHGGRVISLQLGSGCSAAAVHQGKALDTSMGFSPVEGLVMATRSGDVDPGLLTYLQRAAGMGADELDELLNERSGLKGLSGRSGDMRDLLEATEPEAQLAVDTYCHRARKYIGAYLAVLGGVDAILFGGGVGEHLPDVRRRILEGMAWCGIQLDPAANARVTDSEGRVSADGSPVAAWVIPVDEAALLAEAAAAFL